MVAHDNTTSFTQPTANASGVAIPQRQIPQDNSSRAVALYQAIIKDR